VKFQLWFFLHPINAITSVNDPYLAIGGDFYSFFMTSLVKYSDAKNLDVVLTHQLDDISTRFGLGLPNPPFFFSKVRLTKLHPRAVGQGRGEPWLLGSDS
jgi:hypothetical protein